ncbi:MAG: HAD hydrolase family protein [Phycisphaerales bacterium]|nr:HAD hydrolase family protein [Phycisphaerae bacterium]NNF43922.1 HAD hydrolase family protein [Phycisphaerales bacterium]NNM27125.1 HAD hydrolase family protein [Phycisphaerales bacterium]
MEGSVHERSSYGDAAGTGYTIRRRVGVTRVEVDSLSLADRNVPDSIERVQLLVLDVDGVLTDGRITYDDHGRELKSFHARDGLALRLWQRLGHEVAVITGRHGMALRHRLGELGVRHVFQGVDRKVETLRGVLADCSLSASEAAVMGDDLPDLPMLRVCGYPMAVADAVEEVRLVASHVTDRPGGAGAVREAVEHLLKAQGRWPDAIAGYS